MACLGRKFALTPICGTADVCSHRALRSNITILLRMLSFFFLFSSRGSPCRVCLHGTLLHDCSLYRHFHASLRGWTCKRHSSHQLGLWLHAKLSFSYQYWLAVPLPPALAPPSPAVHQLGQQCFVQLLQATSSPFTSRKGVFSAHLTHFLVHRWLCTCSAAGGKD